MTAPLAFPIVGIGASAGGVEALEGFFRGLPTQPGLALVIVTHLSPERESLLHQIIGRYTDLPVHVAADGVTVEQNHVYVLPADAVLGIKGGRLRVHKPNRSRRERKPIDVFFSALATDQGELAAGIVLSGGDSDGTLGVKALKERGGLTLAQVRDGYGPGHPDMPDSAIATGYVDFAVPADQMGAKLTEFARSASLLDQIDPGPGQADGEEIRPGLDAARPEIYAVLRNQVGHDFGGYKTRTFLRRVLRRMQVNQLAEADAYVERLRQDPQEVAALFRDLLISVTNFFRDADAFEALAEQVIPKLFENRGAEDTVRIWVPGCATGEEVFSLGMLLREHMDTRRALPRVQIFATDIDERALAVARAARYPAALLDSVSAERRERFFVADGGSFVVAKDVRELCIFSPHSVIRDPPFSRMDLVSCRNLLIYFGVTVQSQVIPIFHYALRPDGYLFLGTSENVSTYADLFAPLDTKHRIFRRRSDISPSVRLPLTLAGLRPGYTAETAPGRAPLGAAVLRQLAEGQVLERFAPAHVVVNRDGEALHFSGHTGKYLETASGAPARQILTMARKGLRLELRGLLREVVESGQPATREGVAAEGDDGRVQVIDLTVEPLDQRGDGEPLYLVLFRDQGPTLNREEALNRVRYAQNGDVQQTERELRDARERLQSMVEEYDTALEELKSSNEELVSVNEELQSTNEELEANKEELVSVNEELHTVNAELNRKVDELDRANSDLQNLFESTDVATVFLDRQLRIRSFTPALGEVFNVRPSDRGRPITDLASHLRLPGFADDIARVLAGHGLAERRVEHEAGTAHFLVRLAPYRDGESRTEGVVITFVDVTSLTRAEARQRVLIAELQHRTRNLLAVVRSVAERTLGQGSPFEAFAVRLAALGRVQGLISQAVDERVDLGEIVRLELAATGAEDGRVTVAGPAALLSLADAQTFALALHELATNALKYGAFKAEQGRLEVAWAVERRAAGAACLILTWQESGVAMPPEPPRRGYGRELIERALAYTLDARTDLVFGADGVSCRIEMPLAAASDGRPTSSA